MRWFYNQFYNDHIMEMILASYIVFYVVQCIVMAIYPLLSLSAFGATQQLRIVKLTIEKSRMFYIHLKHKPDSKDPLIDEYESSSILNCSFKTILNKSLYYPVIQVMYKSVFSKISFLSKPLSEYIVKLALHLCVNVSAEVSILFILSKISTTLRS